MPNEYVTVVDLANYLQASLNEASAALYVELTNGEIVDLIGVLDPIPTKARIVALEVAARGYDNATRVTSVTKSFDNASKTVRKETSGTSRKAVLLTEDEEILLLGLAGKGVFPSAGSLQYRTYG